MAGKDKHRVVVIVLESVSGGFQVGCGLAVGLGGQGHTVGLWVPRLDYGEALERLFNSQLEIEQAGGISLVHGGLDDKPLDWAIEAFGRVDLLVQPEHDRLITEETLEYLKKPSRPKILDLAYSESGKPINDWLSIVQNSLEGPAG